MLVRAPRRRSVGVGVGVGVGELSRTDNVRFGLSGWGGVNGAEGLIYPAALAKENQQGGRLPHLTWWNNSVQVQHPALVSGVGSQGLADSG